MLIKVNKNNLDLINTSIFNNGEYNVSKINFEFSCEFNNLIKKAIFSKNEYNIEVLIKDNTCDVPYEILNNNFDDFKLGVYGYDTINNNLIRYSPSPITINIDIGSYIKDTTNDNKITPSLYEQYESLLNKEFNNINTNLIKLKNDILSDILDNSTSRFNLNAENQTKIFNNNADNKLAIYNSNADLKIQKLEETKNLLKLFPKINKTGTEITINDTVEAPMKLVLNPSEVGQNTTTGKQLFNYAEKNVNLNGINCTIKNDGTITLNGTATSNFNLILSDTLNQILSAGNYSLNYIYMSGTVSENITIRNNGTPNNALYFTIFKNTSGNQNIIKNLATDVTITAYALYIVKDTVFNNLEFKFLLVKNSTSDFEYEEYTGGQATPSPDYPEDIHVVMGDNTITIANQNNTKSQSLSLTLGNLEFCKIGEYSDILFKNTLNSTYYDSTLELDKWYLKKNILKTTDESGSTGITINDMVSDSTIKSYYGGTVSGKTITYDSAISGENTIYYPTTTPQDILLNETLQSELEEIYNNVTSYQDQTNISQTNDDLSFVISASACYDMNKLLDRVEALESEV